MTRKWNLIVDIGQCEGCHNCVIASRDEHEGNDFPGYAAPASRDTPSLLRILRRVQGDGHCVEATHLPVMCNHCDNPPCLRRAGDAIRKRADGIVIIDPDKARGRRDLVGSCPYQAIVWNEEQQVPQTWIFDAHLLDQGWPVPRCQQVCPTEVFAAVKLDDEAMAERARRDGLRGLRAGLGTRPRVWYRGLDRWETCFIAGTVTAEIDGLNECLAGAVAVLYQGGERLAKAVSDAFGDFRFAGLPPDSGPYRVEIQHALGSVGCDCQIGESVYLGPLSLCKAERAKGVA